LTEDDDLIG